jgi:proteic killer suppression protein
VINHFRRRETEASHAREHVRRCANIASVARRKLRQLELVTRRDGLCVPPGNRLEAPRGNRAGQHGIRIDDRWRVCVDWTVGGAENVEIAKCH